VTSTTSTDMRGKSHDPPPERPPAQPDRNRASGIRNPEPFALAALIALTLLARGKLSLSHASGERDKNGFSPLLPACVGEGAGR